MPDIDNTQLNSLQRAFYALDNHMQYENGFTEQSRAKFIIMHCCEISESCFYLWLKYPRKVKKANRYFVAVALNKNTQQIFQS